MTQTHTIRARGVSATIKAKGAELTSLRDAGGAELLWQAGPEWPQQSPVLFPIVGTLRDDTLIHEGRSYHLTRHGFARHRPFDWVERTDTRAVLRLEDDEETRALYPFAFRLEMIHEVDGETLSVTARVTNPGAVVLPCSVGAHPAFRWPLVEGAAKDAHTITFEARETGSVLPIEDGLLGAAQPLPFDGKILPLSTPLFAHDALVMPDVRSTSVRYATGDGQRALTVAWTGYKDLGIWSKPTESDFVCIEPWFGMASPVGWQGEFADKPGILQLQPGESRDFTWRVAV